MDTDTNNQIDEAYRKGQGVYKGGDNPESEFDSAQNADDILAAENNPEFEDNVTHSETELDQNKLGKNKVSVRKKGGIFGLIVLVLGGGGLMGGLSSATLLPNISSNLESHNSASSTAFGRRSTRVIVRMATSGVTCPDSKNLNCKNKALTKKALRSFSKVGITPMHNGSPIDISRGGGKYPSQTITHYKFEGHTKPVPASQLKEFLRDPANKKFASKIQGRLRVSTRFSNFLHKRFYSKFQIQRNGGTSKLKTSGKTTTERMKSARETMKKRKQARMENKKPSRVSALISNKMKAKAAAGARGGIAYSIARGTCVITRVPYFIAGGVVAIQLARITPLVMDYVLSPGSAQKSGDVTAEGIETAGTLLTEKDKNGKSALDSPHLLYAMGVNHNKPPLSDFAPGLSVLTSPIMMESLAVANSTKDTCNFIMSPTAMYTAMAIETGLTTVASIGTLGLGFVVKLAAGFIAQYAIKSAIEAAVGKLAEWGIEELAGEDFAENLKGEELGDLIGISSMAYFSSEGMSRKLNVLSTDQVAHFRQMMNEQEAVNRQIDIATLSPFDVSSRYTFLGSIIYRMQMASIINGTASVDFNLLSGVKSLASIPLQYFQPRVSAAVNYSSNYCSYGKILDAEIDGKTPAVNGALMPCVGLTPEQDRMSPETAENLLINEGWLDPSKEISGDGDLEDLAKSGVIVKDTPFYSYLFGDEEDKDQEEGSDGFDPYSSPCSDASTGDYLFSLAGCMVPSSVTGGMVTALGEGASDISTGDGEGCVETIKTETESGEESTEIRRCDNISSQSNESGNQTRAYQAMAVFAIDYQLANTINGEDDETSEGIALSSPFYNPLESNEANIADKPLELESDSSEISKINNYSINSSYIYNHLSRLKNIKSSSQPIKITKPTINIIQVPFTRTMFTVSQYNIKDLVL